MRVWANGRLLGDPSEAAVSAVDHGFTVGDGVFESVKVVDGQPFALTRHLGRLAASAAGLGLPVLDEERVRSAVAEVLAGEQPHLGRLRITYTAGPAPMGSSRGDGPASLVVVTDALTPWAGVASAVVVPWVRNDRGAAAGLKTTSYAENVIALAYAHDRGAGEAIFANTRDNLCEGTGSNVFYVVDGQLRTPSLASGCLAGITRDLIIEWCGALECDEQVGVLNTAEEIFLASTTRDIQPVGSIDGRELPAPGPVTAAAMRTWAEREPQDSDP
jgi:branched-chain amino acid aminotransferase